MTNKRDLKALVRERMGKTGETYMQAKAAVQKVVPSEDAKKVSLECIFCSETFAGISDLRSHSADCSKHPAVIEAQRIRQLDRLTAAELREKMTALGATISASEDEQLVAMRGVAGEVPPKIAEWLELSRLAGRAEAREERAVQSKIHSKQSPTEAMKSALAALGVTIDVDGKMFGPNGVPLKAKWTKEIVENVTRLAEQLRSSDTTLMGKNEPRELSALELGAALREREKAFAAGHDPDSDFSGGERNFFVWETEYADDGSVEIYAHSEADAKQKYREETGCDEATELTAKLVSVESDKEAPAYRESFRSRGVRPWAEVKAERYKNNPEALVAIDKKVDEDLAEMLGSQHHFRIGDVDFPIGSLNLKGRVAFMNDRHYTKLPCGHLVLNADSAEARESVKEMSAKFGIDAEADLKAMIAEELARHKDYKCLETIGKSVPDWEPIDKSVPDWQEISKRSPTPEEQKAYTAGGTDATMARRLPSPFQHAKRHEPTQAELKERALLSDPAALKKYLDTPDTSTATNKDRLPPEEHHQRLIADTISQFVSPKHPVPTNVELTFPSTDSIQEVGHIDVNTFTLVRMEKLPCGHQLRKNTEIPMDLKAMYGDAGVEAWNHILEQERQKHLNGKCDEACNDLKLVPRYAPSRHLVVLVLVNEKGECLYPPDGDSYEPPPSLVSVTVNGEPKNLQGPYAVYPELLWAAGLASERSATITYQSAGGNIGGTLTREQRLELTPGMIFNVKELLRVEVIIELNGTKTLVASTETYESLVRLAGFPQRGYPTTYPTVTYRHGQFQGTLPPRKELQLLNGMIVTVEALIGPSTEVTVNGKPFSLSNPAGAAAGWTSYEDVVKAAGFDPERVLSVTYHSKGLTGGILHQGQRLELLPGMVFNIIETNNA